jgi:hypothetical protein
LIEGLQAGADMNDFLAGLNEQSAAHARDTGKEPEAREFDKAAEALRNAATAMRSRAKEEVTGRFRAVDNPGPGWMQKRPTRKTLPVVIGPTEDTLVTRRRRKTRSWWHRLKFW